MKKVLIACTLFNDLISLKKFFSSIEESYDLSKKNEIKIDLTVLVANNGNENINSLIIKNEIKLIKYNNKSNSGYLNGIREAIEGKNIHVQNFNFFIISNVDLKLSKNFFTLLNSISVDKHTGWLAPKIFSHKERKDRNPKILKRPSKYKMYLYYFMYRIPLIYHFNTNLIYRFSRRSKQNNNSRIIYAGHGSFIILTQNFTKFFPIIKFESFLFGEEIFIAELCKIRNLEVKYFPKIRIDDFDHSSTGKLKKSDFFKMNRDSLKYIISKFY